MGLDHAAMAHGSQLQKHEAETLKDGGRRNAFGRSMIGKSGLKMAQLGRPQRRPS
jgi:hypothetical protein